MHVARGDYRGQRAGGATITFSVNGVFQLTLTGANEDAAATGDLDITSAITITGNGASNTIIDGNGTDRIFDILAMPTQGSLTLSGVTLRNGNPPAGNNSSDSGGAIQVQGTGTLTLTDSVISGNTAPKGGGGIASSSGALTITDSTISGNTAAQGGGVAATAGGNFSMTGSTVSGNTGSQVVGGLYISSSGTFTLTDSTVSGHTTGGGALAGATALYNGGTLAVTNSTISGNTGAGPAIENVVGALTLTNVTVAGNYAGLQRDNPNNPNNTITVQNSILANTNANCASNPPATPPTGITEPTGAGYNIDSGNTCGFLASNGSLVNTDPALAPLGNYGGPTQTQAPLTGSPAIDLVPTSGANCPTTDQRGVARPQRAACDSGAVEALPAPTITAVAPTSGTTSGGTTLTITGTNFQTGATVRVGGVDCAIGAVTATQITCTTGPHVAGAVDVVVTNFDAQTVTAAGGFTYVAPTITGVAPGSGPIGGGTPITISGTGFVAGATVRVGNNPCTNVAVAGATTITCTTPGGAPGAADVVVVNPNAPGASGTATRAGGFTYLTTQQAQPNPTSLTFPAQQVNTTGVAQTVTLTNTGTTPLTISGVAITNGNTADFALTTNTCTGATLGANGTCTVGITFTPTAAGNRAASLTFTDDSGGTAGNQQNVGLSGTGTAPTVAFNPTFLTFANQQIGITSASQTVTLTNMGTAPLTIGTIALAGANVGDFVLGGNTCGAPVAINGTCTFSASFEPTATDIRVASVIVTDNANGFVGSQQSVPLIGGGAAVPSPTPGFTVTVTTSGSGTVSPGSGTYADIQNFTATPATGQVFIGWTVDGTFVGFGNPLALPLTKNRTVVATFAARPSFTDVPTSQPYYEAITQLAARGVARGFGDGTFRPEPGPTNDYLVRAQIAGFLVRLAGWDGETHTNPFRDRCDADGRNCIDLGLWNEVAVLNFHDVARGYPDNVYLPRMAVLHVQVVSFITRTMVALGYWDLATADDPNIYPNVPSTSGHRLDLVTFVRYAGAVPGHPANQPWTDWDQPASRDWTAGILFQAYSSYFSTNHIP